MTLLALDVAILPPAPVSARAIALNEALPKDGSKGLRLDADHLPHITLTQQFVRADELDLVYTKIDAVLRTQAPLSLRALGCGMSGNTVWITIDRSRELHELHQRLMHALRGVERPGATADAFVDDARVSDVIWVASYRLKASFGAFTPHITIGHAAEAPSLEPFDFEATTVAACHLGRFCTCRDVLRSWTLSAPSAREREPVPPSGTGSRSE